MELHKTKACLRIHARAGFYRINTELPNASDCTPTSDASSAAALSIACARTKSPQKQVFGKINSSSAPLLP